VGKHLDAILSTVPELGPLVPALANTLFSIYHSNFKKLGSAAVYDQIKKIFGTFERLYPTELDVMVDAILDSGDSTALTAGKPWNALFEGTRHQIMSAGGSQLDEVDMEVEGLSCTLSRSLRASSPPSMTIRALQLLISMASQHVEGSDISLNRMLKTSFENLLGESRDPDVLELIFKSPQLLNIVEASVVFEKSKQLLISFGSENTQVAYKLYNLILSFITQPFFKLHSQFKNQIISILLKCFVNFSQSLETNSSKQAAKSSWCSSAKHLEIILEVVGKNDFGGVFKGVGKVDKKDNLRAAVLRNLITTFASNLEKDFDSFSNLLSEIQTKESFLGPLIYLIYLHFLNQQQGKASEKNCSKVIEEILMNIGRTLVGLGLPKKSFSSVGLLPTPPKSDHSILVGVSGLPTWSQKQFESVLSSPTQAELVLSLVYHVTCTLIPVMKLSEKHINQTRDLFLIISLEKLPKVFYELSKGLVKGCSNGSQFLCQFWLTEGYSLHVQKTSLELLRDVVPETQLVTAIPSLLVGLTSPNHLIRQTVLQCLAKIKTKDEAPTAILAKLKKINSVEERNMLPSFFHDSFFSNGVPETLVNPVLTFLLNSAIQFSNDFGFFKIVESIASFHSTTKFEILVQFLQKSLTHQDQNFSYWNLRTIHLILQEFCPANIQMIITKKSNYWDSFIKLLDPQLSFSPIDDCENPEAKGKIFSPLKIGLETISESFYKALPLELQQQLFGKLLDLLAAQSPVAVAGSTGDQQQQEVISVHDEEEEIQTEELASPFVPPFGLATAKDYVRKLLKKLVIAPSIIQEELKACGGPAQKSEVANDGSQKQKAGSNKRAREEEDKAPQATPLNLSRLTNLFEFFQYNHKSLDHSHVKILFEFLNYFSTNYGNGENSDYGYILQLLLTSLINVTQKIHHTEKQATSESADDQMDEDGPSSSLIKTPKKKSKNQTNNKLSKEKISELEEIYVISIISDCIGIVNNPTIHNSCLSLLTQVCKLFPQKVLANMVSLFSLMGVSAKRSDDSYSFLVIQRAIEGMIPALLSSEPGKGIGVKILINEFITRLDQIPEHRRLLLFSIFIKTLGYKYLPIFLCSIFSEFWVHVARKTAPSGSTSVAPKSIFSDPDAVINFVLSLLVKFPPQYVVHSFVMLFLIFEGISTNKKPSSPDKKDKEIVKATLLEVIHQKANELDSNKSRDPQKSLAMRLEYSSLKLFSLYLPSKDFISQLLALPATLEDKMQDNYLRLFQFGVRSVQRTNTILNSPQVQKYSSQLQQLLSETQSLCFSITDSLNDFLSIDKFISAITLLLKSNDPTLQKQTLLLLNDKLRSESEMPSHKHCLLLIMIVFQLIDVIDKDPAKGLQKETETEAVTKQTAALSIEILSRWLAGVSVYNEKFLEVVPKLISVLQHRTQARKEGKGSPTPHVECSLMLALATLASQLTTSLLPHINSLFSTFLEVLNVHWTAPPPVKLPKTKSSSEASGSDDAMSQDEETDADDQTISKVDVLLRLSAISSIHVVVRNCGKFLTSFLDQLLVLILNPILSHSKQTRDKLEELISLISESFTIAQLVGPIQRAFEKISKLGFSDSQNYLFYSFPLLCSLFGKSIEEAQVSEISEIVKDLFSMFLKFFGLRDYYGDKPQDGGAYQTCETASIAGFLKLIVKLNERTFKPMFLLLLEWIKIDAGLTGALSGQEIEKKQAKEELVPRVFFFYQLIFKLSELLQGIFVPYFSYLLPHIISTIHETIIEPNRHSEKTMTWIYNSLKLCFQYDTSNFVNLTVFETLLPPLIASLEWVYPTPEGYRKRIQGSFIPCVVQLAVNLGQEELLKPLNYQLLLKTRSEDADIRLAAIKSIHAFYIRMGEQFLPLLPESMQFIYELMEDIDPHVEEAVGELRATFEKLLGEESFAELLH